MIPRNDLVDQPLTVMPGPIGNRMEAAEAAGMAPSDPVPVTVAGQEYLVPKPVADALAGASGLSNGGVPEHYALPTRPEFEAAGYQPSEDHPLYEPATKWCRKHGITQEAFDELAGVFQDHEIGAYGNLAEFREKEFSKLFEGFAPGMDAKDPAAQEIAVRGAADDQRWLTSLMGPALRGQPELNDVVADLYHLADGARFVRALREVIGERTPGTLRAAASPEQPKSLADLLYDHPTSR